MLNISSAINKNIRVEKIKTTNVNILLNKVRLDKKKDFQKGIIFLSLLISLISFATIFAFI